MKNIKFNPFKYLFLICLCLTLSACSGGLNAGLEAYQSPDGRYAFLYPTGWTRVKAVSYTHLTLPTNREV